ncbi:MAG: DMT family transporter [Bryobacteraceae bacterium]
MPRPQPPSLAQPAAPFRFSHRQSLTLVFLCTLFGVAAQFLIKTSTTHAMFSASGRLSLTALLTNYPLWAGLTCYGASTLLLILALRDGELSLLYPVISLTYVWVVALSALVFHESLNAGKVVGVALICSGVALLGMERNKR